MSTTFPPESSAVQAEVLDGLGLSLAAAAKLLPSTRAGRPVSPSTTWRWSVEGAPSLNGRRIRLEVCRVGCRWLTSRHALERFLSALQPKAPHNDAAEKVIPRPTVKSGKGAATAREQLKKVGI